jgi:hypothetical protein
MKRGGASVGGASQNIEDLGLDRYISSALSVMGEKSDYGDQMYGGKKSDIVPFYKDTRE